MLQQEICRKSWMKFCKKVQDLFRVDDNIIIAFHSSGTLKIITKKTKLDIRIVQLLKLMGAPLLKLTLVKV